MQPVLSLVRAMRGHMTTLPPPPPLPLKLPLTFAVSCALGARPRRALAGGAERALSVAAAGAVRALGTAGAACTSCASGADGCGAGTKGGRASAAPSYYEAERMRRCTAV